MRFIVDECTGPQVAKWLQRQGYDAVSVFDELRGAEDDEIIRRALEERRILISNDKDFGRKVYADGRCHTGVILLRLNNERSASKIEVLSRLLREYKSDIPNTFVVVTEERVRFTPQRL